jgi:hypothetical protein
MLCGSRKIASGSESFLLGYSGPGFGSCPETRPSKFLTYFMCIVYYRIQQTFKAFLAFLRRIYVRTGNQRRIVPRESIGNIVQIFMSESLNPSPSRLRIRRSWKVPDPTGSGFMHIAQHCWNTIIKLNYRSFLCISFSPSHKDNYPHCAKDVPTYCAYLGHICPGVCEKSYKSAVCTKI